MKRIRVIPVLLLNSDGLVKSVKFKDYIYIGDPINAVKIFNDKEVDEIVILDIEASKSKKSPDFARIKEIAGEAFIPLAYGGGISSIEQVAKLFYLGVEKVIFNYAAVHNLRLINETAKLVGNQSVVVSLDIKKSWLGKYNIYTLNGKEIVREEITSFAKRMVNEGAGEIFLNSIDKDGTSAGYDLELVKMISSAVSVPVIACGGAGKVEDFIQAVNSGASAVAAGSLFVLQPPHKAVLISYPSQKELEMKLYNNLTN